MTIRDLHEMEQAEARLADKQRRRRRLAYISVGVHSLLGGAVGLWWGAKVTQIPALASEISPVFLAAIGGAFGLLAGAVSGFNFFEFVAPDTPKGVSSPIAIDR